MSNDDENKKPDEFDAKTFLYIRTNPADDGTTPLPAGLIFWISPDITIIRPGGLRGSEANVDEAEIVEVIVTNGGGIDAIDAYVEAFVANPSTGFTPATAKRVGDGFVSIPHNNTQAITFPWTPSAEDAGHRCLFARVCLSFPPDCYTDASIFDVVGDRHVAQRNINVVDFENSSTLSFGFQIVNPMSEKGGAFIIKAKELTVTKRNEKNIQLALGSKFAQFAKLKLRGIGLQTIDNEAADNQNVESKNELIGVLSKPFDMGKSNTIRFKMREKQILNAVVTMARNPDVRKGDLNIVQIEQIDLKTQHLVGGLWIVLKN